MRLHPGEPEATGWRPMSVPGAVRHLLAASPGVTGRPRVIAIDGRGGAGKTTLAGRLRAAVPGSAIVHLGEQERLLAARDGESPEQLAHVARWLLEEVPLLSRERPWARATMIVAGPAPAGHDPGTGLLVAPPAGR
ncbi:hypothetical protein [Sphaerisporangium corydalis]|uniref:Uridine kinase n=1 Tax=Sphaerisporangium corydalis TaxID=1441875 RepID=A0ABV9EDW3_9ACTN|nr:hypothetical protein [Sphaerisporangium corydalis]